MTGPSRPFVEDHVTSSDDALPSVIHADVSTEQMEALLRAGGLAVSVTGGGAYL